jgi:hypothetical protein
MGEKPKRLEDLPPKIQGSAETKRLDLPANGRDETAVEGSR